MKTTVNTDAPEYQEPVPPPLPYSFLRDLFSPLSPLRNEEEGQNQPLPLPPPAVTAIHTCLTLDKVRNGLQRNSRNNNNSINKNVRPSPVAVHAPGSSSSLYRTEDLKAQVKSQNEELEQLILAHGEQLKRKLAQRDQLQYRSLLLAAEAAAAKKLRDKEASLDRAVRHAGELQVQLENLRREASALRTQTGDKNQIILSLHAQLRRAEEALAHRGAGRGSEGSGESGEAAADDAESGCVDPSGRMFAAAACRECRERPAEVAVLPCRHLCLCAECNRSVAPLPCPVCQKVRTGYMQVFMN